MASKRTCGFWLGCLLVIGWFQSPLGAQGEGQTEPYQDATRSTYLVGPQDVLRITVFDEPDLSGPFKVDADGTFTFPLVGRVSARDRTLHEIEGRLVQMLSDGYLKSPHLTVEVEHYRSQNVYVLGEVRTPGVISLAGNMNLIEALVKAGSTTAAAGNEVQIVHPTGDREVSRPILPHDGDQVQVDVTVVDLRNIRTGRLSRVPIRDGDTIYVPKAAKFFVTGHVREPGSFVWERGIIVLQAISLAGGMTERGSNRRIKILRIVDGKQQSISVHLNDPVQPGDTIRVRQRFF